MVNQYKALIWILIQCCLFFERQRILLIFEYPYRNHNPNPNSISRCALILERKHMDSSWSRLLQLSSIWDNSSSNQHLEGSKTSWRTAVAVTDQQHKILTAYQFWTCLMNSTLTSNNRNNNQQFPYPKPRHNAQTPPPLFHLKGRVKERVEPPPKKKWIALICGNSVLPTCFSSTIDSSLYFTFYKVTLQVLLPYCSWFH